MNEKTVLIVEDDKSIQNFLNISLKANDYKVVLAESGQTGISLFLSHNPDIILLDLGLPDIDGTKVLEGIRQSSNIPIIIISARGQEKEKVAALDLGADDYVTKPFSVGELLARVRVALRHYKPNEKTESIFSLDALKIDFERRKVFKHDDEIHLTPIEYKILVLLINHLGKVLTHKFIQHEIWGYASVDEYQSLRVFMANIRRKIEDNTTNPRYIITEVGVGYRFVDE